MQKDQALITAGLRCKSSDWCPWETFHAYAHFKLEPFVAPARNAIEHAKTARWWYLPAVH